VTPLIGPADSRSSAASTATLPAATSRSSAATSVRSMAGRLVPGSVRAVLPDPQLDRDDLELIALAGAAAAGLCLLLLLFVLGRVRALSKRIRRLAAAPRDSAAGAVDPHALRHVAVVRYDAFGDMGGRLSFSAAVIDDHGDGLVFSSIHARGESRTYAKGVVGGRSSITLTPEEQQALASATQGETRTSAPTALRHPDRTKDAS
jgi:hypothetical protein